MLQTKVLYLFILAAGTIAPVSSLPLPGLEEEWEQFFKDPDIFHNTDTGLKTPPPPAS